MIHTLMMSPQEKHVTWCDERIFWQPHFQNPEYNGDIDASCWNYCPEEEGIKTLFWEMISLAILLELLP